MVVQVIIYVEKANSIDVLSIPCAVPVTIINGNDHLVQLLSRYWCPSSTRKRLSQLFVIISKVYLESLCNLDSQMIRVTKETPPHLLVLSVL